MHHVYCFNYYDVLTMCVNVNEWVHIVPFEVHWTVPPGMMYAI